MKKITSFLLALSTIITIVPVKVIASDVSWNTASNDCKTVAIAIHETQEGYGYPCWPGTTVSANPGQSVNIRIYYHNTGTITATNTMVVLDAPTINSPSSGHTFTGQIISDQGSSSSFSVRVNLSSSQKLTYYSTAWYTENTNEKRTSLLYGQNGQEVLSGGLKIGSIAPGWSTQGSVVVTFRVDNPTPTGNITAANPSCIVSNGQNTCPISFSWNTNNPINGVVSNVLNNNNQIIATGNNGTQSFYVPLGASTYRLTHNNTILDTESVAASCASGSTINNTGYCEQIKPTGDIFSEFKTCQIQAGQNSCTIPFSWNTTNPIGTSSVTKDGTYGDYKTGNTGNGVLFTIPFGSSTFRLYNGGYELDNESVSASCASGTNWDSSTSTCKLPVYDCVLNNFTANPISSSPGDLVNLSWDSTHCTSVNISGVANGLPPSGTRSVWPTITTTYVLTGIGETTARPTKTATVTVGGPAGAPTFPAGAPTFGA